MEKWLFREIAATAPAHGAFGVEAAAFSTSREFTELDRIPVEVDREMYAMLE